MLCLFSASQTKTESNRFPAPLSDSFLNFWKTFTKKKKTQSFQNFKFITSVYFMYPRKLFFKFPIPDLIYSAILVTFIPFSFKIGNVDTEEVPGMH